MSLYIYGERDLSRCVALALLYAFDLSALLERWFD